MPAPGMLRHPVIITADAALRAAKMKVRFENLFSILPILDTMIASLLRIPTLRTSTRRKSKETGKVFASPPDP
jgi:hypothetical protein